MLLLELLVIQQGLQLKASPGKSSSNLMYDILDNSGIGIYFITLQVKRRISHDINRKQVLGWMLIKNITSSFASSTVKVAAFMRSSIRNSTPAQTHQK